MTGIQFLHFNTLYQLKYLVDENPEILKKTKNILLLPDMIAYMLTGAIKTEITNASTTNLMNPNTFDWDKTLCEKLGIPTHIFPEIMDTGEIYGNLSERICNELGCKSVPVIAVATHDTASAVVSVPSSSDSFAYLSCGTWSLLGTELNHPCINNDTMQHNFTNEIGYDKTIRLLKNIMGLWLVQESKRCFSKDDVQISFAVLEQEALSSEPFLCYIDPDAPEFEAPGNIPERVQEYCRKTGQHVPKNRGEIMRCIYQSIAMKYKYCFNSLQHIANHSFNILHMVGGGIKDRLLCQMTADACGIAVHAGPVEATVMGNIAAQLISLAEIRDLKSAREIIGNSTDIKVHFPSQADVWEQKYTDFLRSVNL
jgi:rhamnulokinase/L-fuculokinase